jgi:hypothetical protein
MTTRAGGGGGRRRPAVDWIDESQVGPPVPLDALPTWLREMSGDDGFLRVHRLEDGSGEWLLRCRGQGAGGACTLSLGIAPALAQRLPLDEGLVETIMRLATHGVAHALNGELPWLEAPKGGSAAAGPPKAPPGRQGRP